MLTKHEQYVNDRKAFVTTVIVHALLLLLFLFFVVWRQPDPPTPGMPGIELNFGLDAAGSGDNNSTEPASEPTVSETTPVETITPTESTEAPTTPVTSTLPSEHTVVKSTTVSTSTTTPQKTTSVSSTQPATNPKNLMKPNPGDGTTGTTGNQGDPNGSTNSKNYYGKSGTGDGGSGTGSVGDGLSLSGWRWKKKPSLPQNPQEEGQIVFKIKIDEDGQIISIVTDHSSVSPATVKQYEKILWSAEFEPNGANVAPSSTGTVTFNIKKSY
ncbi:MAG: hypothetical protein MUE33_08835 [Cytophagaceae bacterium]|jgi:outer membrane biosynthesis protein TonB|nr:hypothetical protein [Cytophagaceae bacterium]